MLLVLTVSATLSSGPSARPATLDPVHVTVTIGEPRVISVESEAGWTAPGAGVVAPVPVAPAQLRMTIPAPAPRAPALRTI